MTSRGPIYGPSVDASAEVDARPKWRRLVDVGLRASSLAIVCTVVLYESCELIARRLWGMISPEWFERSIFVMYAIVLLTYFVIWAWRQAKYGNESFIAENAAGGVALGAAIGGWLTLPAMDWAWTMQLQGVVVIWLFNKSLYLIPILCALILGTLAVWFRRGVGIALLVIAPLCCWLAYWEFIRYLVT